MDHPQLQEIKKHGRKKSRRNKREEMERKNNAIDTANKIADFLKNKYSVQKVYLTWKQLLIRWNRSESESLK